MSVAEGQTKCSPRPGAAKRGGVGTPPMRIKLSLLIFLLPVIDLSWSSLPCPSEDRSSLGGVPVSDRTANGEPNSLSALIATCGPPTFRESEGRSALGGGRKGAGPLAEHLRAKLG